MGFGFNLFGFPILILTTIFLLVFYVIFKKKTTLIILSGLWGFTITLFLLNSLFAAFNSPIRLTKEDIVGEYRVDTNFYPGKNAQWQYSHFKFYITDKDSILFFVMDDHGLPSRKYVHALNFTAGPPVKWTVLSHSTHPIIREKPTLYRGRKRFYYVFETKAYSNMFFRKVEE